MLNWLKTFVQKFGNDWAMNLVSMVTYSLITTIFPLLLGILTIAALILNFLPLSSIDSLAANINSALPANLTQGANGISVKQLLTGLASASGVLAIVSLVGLLFTGSNLFTSMENAFSVIYKVKDRGFIGQRLMGMGMVLVLALLLPISLAASSLVTAGSEAFKTVLPGPLGVLLTIVGPLTSVGVLFVLFLIIFRVVPNRDVGWRGSWRGALVAAVIFAVLNILFPLYFRIFLSGNNKFGGFAASALVLLAWLWFFVLATIIGAEVNSIALGVKPLPYDVPSALVDDYRRTMADPVKPPRRRGATSLIPRPSIVGAAVANVGSALGRVGHLLGTPLRWLAVAAWFVARPLVFLRTQRRTES